MEKMPIFPCVSFLVILILTILFSTFLVSGQSVNSTMTVEVNIFGFSLADISPDIGIEVPEKVYLGNITKGDPVSEEIRINVNNTGKTDIVLTIDLLDHSDEIFSNLYMRKQKSSTVDPTLAQYKRIGDYKMSIDKPSSGKLKRSAYFYMILNLTDYSTQIERDIIGYKTDIIFYAMPK